MIDAALNGSMGSWSPSVILASVGSAIDRIADRSSVAGQDPAAAPSGAGAAFERALAQEMLKAGDTGPFDVGELQNGAMLSRAGESQQTGGRIDRFDPGISNPADAAGGASAAGDAAAIASHRRVGFGDQDTSAGLFADGDRFDRHVDGHDRHAFWVGDRFVDQPAFRGDGSTFVDEPVIEPIATGRVFFNGDGRPILLPSTDVEPHDEPPATDGFADGSDLMILPDGAVLAYDPWTAGADGDPIH